MPVLYPGLASETQLDHDQLQSAIVNSAAAAEITIKPSKPRKIMGSLSQALRGIKLQSSDGGGGATADDNHNHSYNQVHHHHQHHRHQLVVNGKAVPAEPPLMAYDSSGSVHEPGTVCLAAMVNEFIEDVAGSNCGRARCNCRDGAHGCDAEDGNGDDCSHDLDEFDELSHIMEEAVNCFDKLEARVLKDVMHSVQLIHDDESMKDVDPQFWVMKHLRSAGYNAAVCKSRWENAGALPAGNYEYIDVISGSIEDRIVIDTDFQAQFEIARASERYNGLLKMVPCIFVGKPKRLSIVLKIMSEGAKLSLKHMGMHLPPWRKHCYLQAKWFSSYKRTIRSQPCSDSSVDVAHCLGNIAFKAPFFSSKFKAEVEDFYGHKDRLAGGGGHHHNHHPNNNKSSVLPLAHEITVITTDWQLPALNPSKFTRDRPPRRPISALAHALRQQQQQAQTSTTIKKQPQRLHFLGVAC